MLDADDGGLDADASSGMVAARHPGAGDGVVWMTGVARQRACTVLLGLVCLADEVAWTRA